MTKEELEKEAEDYAREWLYYVKDLELHHKEDDKPEYIRIKEAYLASAKSREKRIAELEATYNKWFEHLKNREEELLNELNNQNAKYNKQIAELEDKLANADYQPEGRDLKIKELEHQLTHRNCVDCSNHSSKLKMKVLELEKENEELKARVEKQNADILALKSLTERQRLRIEALDGQTPWKDIKDKSELIKENAELKRIVKMVAMINKDIYTEEGIKAIYAEAEHFISEVEK